MDKPETQSQNRVKGQMESSPRSLHTRGPWFVSSSIIVVSARLDKIICNTMTFEAVSPIGITEASANANLISAAPELLTMLKALLIDARDNIEEIGGCDHSVGICCCDLIRNADAAAEVIAKAEGAPSVPDVTDSSTTSY